MGARSVPPRGAKTHAPYPPEFRARAVELVRVSGLSATQVARDLGLSPDTVQGWARQDEIDRGQREGLTTDERAELAQLRRENRILRLERDLLKKAAVFFAKEGDTIR